ncbi:MAG TPA: glycosyltransferase [Povalibacter sp.]|uniref:glycosyltransferase n=1 Tax=Povalibacter sp. TaxID=1962978 RepID=UPI002C4A8D61|nr:glycosyltransferase [Povalibacter sp.]HMN44901.1 glycosyltransferase [Povalibacter sp.]
MKSSSYLVAIVFAAITFGLWAWLNKPVDEPQWPHGVQGMAFSPFHADQDPADRTLPSPAQIDADLALLAGASVNAVRTYSTLDTLAEVPALAARHQIKVALGAWLDRDRATNEKEVAAAIELARRHGNVIRVIIGNESVLRGDLTAEELGAHLDRVRAAVDQPVSTAEPWHVWISHPQLVEHVDFIGVHLLPYWEGIPVESAIAYMDSRIELLAKTFPGKPIVISEVGWPSEGRTREGAVASLSNEALFLRRFLAHAREEGYVYYIMEAFDQPWKARYEGAVGAYWGVYNVQRQPKFEFIKPIVRIPQWQMLAGISVVTAAILLLLVYTNTRGMGTRGRSFLAMVIYAAATCAVLVIYRYSQQYLTLTSLIVGTLLIFGMLGVIAVVISEAIEWAEARWVRQRRRALVQPLAAPATWPRVSIHVPAYNEPAPMLIETLNALARLDYPDYEVLVIDNNTPDETVWQPVEAHCRTLGPRFRFFHVKPLAGFKAGALDYALQRTDASAAVIAVIDSDYQVDPHWLKDLVPAFADPQVAIVQAPQDYRDHGQNIFKAMCYAEYRGFFHIGMITRNERNAIIQHGTMTLVQRVALDRVGGWAQWSITEDAELGLRLFEHGYQAHYLPRSYGRGLMPDTFVDYKKQRFRWAYGAMQILRRHATALFSNSTQLTRGQRYHFLTGWLPWLTDGLNLIVNVAAVGWSMAMIWAPQRIDPPLVMFSLLPLALFTFKLVKLAHLYVSRVGANIRQTIAAALAGLALSHTIGLAVVKGMLTRNEPFFRTPKGSQPHALARTFAGAAQETGFLIVLLTAVYFLTHQLVIAGRTVGVPAELRGPDLSIWVAVLMIQSIPYAASLLVSLLAALSPPARWLGPIRGQREEEFHTEITETTETTE